MEFYIAYGSNLSVEQMAFRCPTARIVGTTVIRDWKLAFGRHATIEPCQGAKVPALVWAIEDEDERSLDRYEGFPKYYEKDWLAVEVDGEPLMAMVYIMTEIQKAGTPSLEYCGTILEGYKRFGFDQAILEKALDECMKGGGYETDQVHV